MKVNAYTTGYLTPSARYRVRQLVPYLEKKNVTVSEMFSSAGAFPPSGINNQLIWAAKNLTENALKVLMQPDADVTWLQKVMFSKHYTFERFLKNPLIFDVDDAIFVKNRGIFAQKIAMKADRVICGNIFLADYFSNFNKNIDIIPTAVDLSRYDSTPKTSNDDIFYILWTGSSSGYPFVYEMEEALKVIVDKFDFVKIKIISNSPPDFKLLQYGDFEFSYWSEEIEFSSIKNCHLGIMPLPDNIQTRGKCSYKMLCYMAGKLPVVVSAVGMNNDVLKLGEIGFGVSNNDEWVDAIETIIMSKTLQNRFANNGRSAILNNFDVNIIANKVHDSFSKLV
ncbi:glycosyltransferase [Flavobacterium sp. 14A]|uniref:glycosyltransferase n=1 Tax=Flavobacterium sp. 14A TaxID=2735896 RepID=UPI00156F573D|nr:glycosyltransferase [Flavobacterium sp. 14A]NRT10965.1 glycosyltransferase involved in cell wall biosynthesis [Flavobacterium sp. 14A]